MSLKVCFITENKTFKQLYIIICIQVSLECYFLISQQL